MGPGGTRRRLGGPPLCGDLGAGEGGDTQAVQGGDIRDGEGDPQFRISVPGAVFPVPVAGGLLPVPVALPWCDARFPVPVSGPTAPVGAAPPRRT